MGELDERDSLDLGMSSASLPPLCSADFDDLLKFFTPNQHQHTQQRSRPDGDTDPQVTAAQFALLAPAQLGQSGQQFLTLQASPASQAMPFPRQFASYTGGTGNQSEDPLLGEKHAPVRRASWAGPSAHGSAPLLTAVTSQPAADKVISHALATLPPFSAPRASEAAVLPTPTPFAAPLTIRKDGSGSSTGTGGAGSPALSRPFSQNSSPRRSSSNGGSGASNCAPVCEDDAMGESEPMDKPFAGGRISITQDAQMFISGAPFVFQSVGIKEEANGGCRIAMSPALVPGDPMDSSEATAQRRVEARKERNRRAQRTFRQRQKHKMLDLEAELAALMHRRDALKAQNVNLNANVSLLTKVLEVRERQILEMNRKEDAANSIHLSDDALFQALHSSRGAPRFLSAWLEGGKPAEITVDFICQLTPERTYKIYLAYGHEICECMKMLDAGTTDTTKLTQLTRELTRVLVLFFNRRADNYINVREIAERPMPPTYSLMEVMKNATEGIRFDPHQRQSIANKWRWMEQRNACIESELTAVQAELNAALPSEVFTAPIYQELREANNCAGRIERLRDELHSVKMEYVYYACKVMTSEQIARIVAACYPVIPNVTTMGNIFAHETGEVRSAMKCPEIEPPCFSPSGHGRELMPATQLGDDTACLTANCSQEIPSSICDDYSGHFVPT